MLIKDSQFHNLLIVPLEYFQTQISSLLMHTHTHSPSLSPYYAHSASLFFVKLVRLASAAAPPGQQESTQR